MQSAYPIGELHLVVGIIFCRKEYCICKHYGHASYVGQGEGQWLFAPDFHPVAVQRKLSAADKLLAFQRMDHVKLCALILSYEERLFRGCILKVIS